MEVPEFCTRPARRVTRSRKTELERDPDFEEPKKKKGRAGGKKERRLGRKIVVVAEEDEAPVGAPPPAPAPPPVSAPAAVSVPSPATPATGTKNKPWQNKKIIKRSKPWALDQGKPKPELLFVQRPSYAVEDWRERAFNARKSREYEKKKVEEAKKKIKRVGRGGAQEGKGKKVEGTTGGKKRGPRKKEDGEQFNLSTFKPLEKEIDPLTLLAEEKYLTPDNLKLGKIPKWVMGEGKGEPGGPPKYEYKSQWDFELPPCNPDIPLEEEAKNYPWRKEDRNKPDFTPEILSMVATFTVGRRLELKTIADRSINIEYNPERYAPLIMRIRNPKCTGLIFKSGRVILTGLKSREECRLAARKYTRLLQRQGLQVKVLGLSIQNISAHCQLNFRVRLNHLANNKVLGHLSYEPELFPGLIIPLEYPRVKVIVFCSGSVLLTGARSEQDMDRAFKAVYPLLRMYAP